MGVSPECQAGDLRRFDSVGKHAREDSEVRIALDDDIASGERNNDGRANSLISSPSGVPWLTSPLSAKIKECKFAGIRDSVTRSSATTKITKTRLSHGETAVTILSLGDLMLNRFKKHATQSSEPIVAITRR